jgi:glycosyltransferase involved in cell wall biosynthesis
MRILFAAPFHAGLLGNTGGVYREMQLRAAGLQASSVTVDFIQPWQPIRWDDYDAAHLFMANGDSIAIAKHIQNHLPLIVSPIIDRTEPHYIIRLMTALSEVFPGTRSHLGDCKTILKMADGICVRSTEELQRVNNSFLCNKSAAIVPCISFVPDTQSCTHRFKQYSEKNFVLFVGDAGNRRKNITRLIRAIKQIKVPLVIAGNMSPSRTGRIVRSRIQNCELIDNVGMISEDEKFFLMQHAAAFVLPSEMEGIGLAAIEAGLCGTTVVVTKHGGAFDYFGTDAYYVNPRNTQEIGRQIQNALANTRNPRDTILEKTNPERATGNLIDLYSLAINTRKKIQQAA